MLKDLNVNQLFFTVALGLGILNLVVILLINLYTTWTGSWIITGSFLIVLVTFNYIIIKYILGRYLFNRVSLLSKRIRNTKLEKETSSSKRFDGNLSNINNEVSQWAESTKNEIEYLKKLEDYRKNFVGNLSHELKTPIFSIQGYLYTLLDGGLEDKRINKKYIQRAANNVDRLQTIVEDLEIINKLESGSENFDFIDFDIRQLAQEVYNDLEFMAKKKKIRLTFMKGSRQSFNAYAGREGIRQVLTNLVSNSIKYGHDGGKTELNFFDIEDNKVLIEVSDDGIGIEQKHLSHLFDRFYRIDPSRSRKQGGSGLGLAIVKHIIEAHGQAINVRSTPGEGSTFSFTLSQQKQNK